VEIAVCAMRRRRTASCGSCEACTRSDCGRCINCVDKPKFGGQGIRKQSCTYRRCMRPKGVDEIESMHERAAAALEAAAHEDSGSNDAPNNGAKCQKVMREDDLLFWTAVEGCMALHSNGSPTLQPTPSPASPNVNALAPLPTNSPLETPVVPSKRLRSVRCGTCASCNRTDCGTCKNCIDKPKFGGPGNRKQACVMRTCSTVRLVDEAELHSSDEDEVDQTPSALGGQQERALQNEGPALQERPFKQEHTLQQQQLSNKHEKLVVYDRPLLQERHIMHERPTLQSPYMAVLQQHMSTPFGYMAECTPPVLTPALLQRSEPPSVLQTLAMHRWVHG